MASEVGRRAVVNRIRKLSAELGRAPKIAELVELTDLRYRDVLNNFESYSEALIIAGVRKTRRMVELERKRRGYIPPWNFIGGETKIPDEIQSEWRDLSKSLIEKIGYCEPAVLGQHPEGMCAGRLIANHIIPRRVGGPILNVANIDIMCDRAHKVHKPDLYWFTEADIDFAHLQDYQIARLSSGGLI